MIDKIQSKSENFRINMYYYHSAREAMYEAICQLCQRGYKDVFIPGYIGWSPREGSGIFDPLNSIEGLNRHYYRMTSSLEIDMDYLRNKLPDNTIFLIVNYFGFRDRNVEKVIGLARERNCVIVEDNAHGFFTFFCHGTMGADITFFSLHKMFPFSEGGGLLILNDQLGLDGQNHLDDFDAINPFAYDINSIARVRKENFRTLTALANGKEALFIPLKGLQDIDTNVPQTFPIKIKTGNRDKIYELMNQRGYGVVSLYHTMIDELKNDKHKAACELSHCIMNLPVHQDCNIAEFEKMLVELEAACKCTKEGF